MITKALIQSINQAGNRCIVRMPLFETASNSKPVVAEALVNIAPGVFNNLSVGDVVFVGFEENSLDKPIILGKLFRGATTENNIRGGGGVFDTLKVNTSVNLPAATNFTFPVNGVGAYSNLNSPLKQADYIKWLENLTKQLISQQEANFNIFKNWATWKLSPENLSIDDGDLSLNTSVTPEPSKNYTSLSINKSYPNT